jgi:hypothetical protein
MSQLRCCIEKLVKASLIDGTGQRMLSGTEINLLDRRPIITIDGPNNPTDSSVDMERYERTIEDGSNQILDHCDGPHIGCRGMEIGCPETSTT